MSEQRSELEAYALWGAAHVLVPVALIGLLGGLVHYLLDLRSVLLGYGTFFLKWVGSLFVIGAVLIGRYGRVHADKARATTYKVALGFSMFVAMTVFGMREQVLWVYVFHLGVVVLLFWLAGNLTALLDLEDAPKHGGAELLAIGAALSHQAGVVVPDHFTSEVVERRWYDRFVEQDALKSPARAVAVLTVVTLTIMAAGGPLLMKGSAGLARQALGALVVTLISAGVLLAAGVATSSVREVRERGGQASVRVLGFRLALALALVVPALVVGLGTPGLDWVGSGEIEAAKTGGESGGAPMSSSQDAADKGQKGLDASPAPPSGFLAALAALAKVAFKVVAILGGIWLLWQLAKRLRLRKPEVDAKQEPPRTWPDPFAGLSAVGSLPPREAVVAVWERYEALGGRNDCPRPERATASEFVRLMPKELRVPELATLYDEAAWSGAQTPEEARSRAIALLRGLQHA